MKMVEAFDSVASARSGFKQMLDSAQEGGAGLVSRGDTQFALVSADLIRSLLLRQVSLTPEVHFDADAVTVLLPSTPIAAEGSSLEEALDEMIAALREYAEDWPTLRHAPNHSSLQPLVLLVHLLDDDQLAAWLNGNGDLAA